jgi:ribonuclease T2
MNFNSKSLRRLSPIQQVLLVGLVLVIAMLYQILVPGAGESPQPTASPDPIDELSPTSTQNVSSTGTSAAVATTSRTPTSLASQTAERKSTSTLAPSPTVFSQPMSKFDYFVLSLSWSPDYCTTSGGDDPQQCSIGKKLGFVLHGLWPQNNQGYPADCTSEKMPQSVKNQFVGLYPNDALFDHEWEKHGTCTGLTPAQFLTLSKQIKNSVVIPSAYRAPEAPFRTTAEQLRSDFSSANPSFTPAAFEVNCSGSGRYLKELYVCFSRSGTPMACGSEVHKDALKSCQATDFVVRNIR